MNQILEIDPSTIVVRERLRPVDPNYVATLVELIDGSCWVNPGTVRREYSPDGDEILVLVEGGHRREACI